MRDFQLRHYRKRIYDSYVSQMVCPGKPENSERIYRLWGDSAHSRLRGWLPKNRDTPILDMGCGSGHFLYLLDRLGYTNLTGIDLSGEQVTLAKRWCPNAKIILGDVRDVLCASSSHYGLITGFDIIEHFDKEEILPFLELIVNALIPSGRLILQTPNAGSPWFGDIAYSDFTHGWFFTPRSLRHLMLLCGLAQFEARACKPYVHGLKSLSRMVLWHMLEAMLASCNLVETGSVGSRIYTRVFISSAVKIDQL